MADKQHMRGCLASWVLGELQIRRAMDATTYLGAWPESQPLTVAGGGRGTTGSSFGAGGNEEGTYLR